VINMATPEPPPTPGGKIIYKELLQLLQQALAKDPFEKIMHDHIMDRVKFGFEKYGVYLESNNGRDASIDAIQECIDLCMYVGQMVAEEEGDKWEIQLLWLKTLYLLADLEHYKSKH